LLLAGEFAVKATQSYAEGLQSTQWIAVVERKHIFRHSTELHHNVVNCTQPDSDVNNTYKLGR